MVRPYHCDPGAVTMIFDAIRESHDLQRDLCRKLGRCREVRPARVARLRRSKLSGSANDGFERRLMDNVRIRRLALMLPVLACAIFLMH